MVGTVEKREQGIDGLASGELSPLTFRVVVAASQQLADLTLDA
jgi:hypothetical protein